MKKQIILLGLFILAFLLTYSQGSPDYTGGLKVKLNDDGTKYFRIISWAQMQAAYNNNVADNASSVNFNLRRARILMFAQINSKFMILTHFGLNSLNANTLARLEREKAHSSSFTVYGHNIVWGKITY